MVHWIGWLSAAIATTAILTAFCFSTFQTKAQAQVDERRLYERLDAMDKKLDALMLRP